MKLDFSQKKIVFIDSEIGIQDKKIHDIGALDYYDNIFHSDSITGFQRFLYGAEYVCGHNIVHHDLKYLSKLIPGKITAKPIDTLYLSPLLFPKKPYHKLVKDDKLQTDSLNNPVNDYKKAADLFYDEVNAFEALPNKTKLIFYYLLYEKDEFTGFFDYINFKPHLNNIARLIQSVFSGKICSNVDLRPLIRDYSVELAYSLALIGVDDYHSITPPWLLFNYPKIETVMNFLRNTPCSKGCTYCKNALNIHKQLNNFFGYNEFRTYNGEPLQEKAAKAAVDGKSLLAVFPTGGGKSITFQLPALIAGKNVHGLTVVISPLQSLMKDQVDNLNHFGITDAVTVNGLLDPIERANALERVFNGEASILYVSPELLRSRTIYKLLRSRNISRFVIDEAHCFSAWGQDFRVDYLYIGDFIRKLQDEKTDKKPIPISCFTATAKQKVITDICDYFKRKLNLDLEIYASEATRENLHYTVLYKETDSEKYIALRNLISQKQCPTIVYVSRTKRTRELAEKLTQDGFLARPFNGKMDSNEKIQNQEAFNHNEINVMVATSAFGMGVDKKDVKLVIHYDISSSLEDYVQEAGRAGRDPSMQADCYVLFNDKDLDKHFILLNQTKLSISEIQNVWRAIKTLTMKRSSVCCSPLEIARAAGWDGSGNDIEMRVRTAISALENAGYVKRGNNVPRVYATSILANDMKEASFRIDHSRLFSESERLNAKRIIKSLISTRSISRAGNAEAESRIDYLADILGIRKEEVINIVNLMRQDGLLADSKDISAYIFSSDTERHSKTILESFSKIERLFINLLEENGNEFNFKELNEAAQKAGISDSSVKKFRTILFYHAIKNTIKKEERAGSEIVYVYPMMDIRKLKTKAAQRLDICRFILGYLYTKVSETPASSKDEKPVLFSVVGLYQEYSSIPRMELDEEPVSLVDIEDSLLYLSKIGALKLEGGFLVLYNALEIKRLIQDNRIQYKVDDYRFLDEFYKQKIQQIHIIGEYANLMVKDYNAALKFVHDYFQLDYKLFINTYFQGERVKDINRNITPEKYHKIIDGLSEKQSDIIHNTESKCIVVAAGPGSGKTRVLVHKLATLIQLEDVKSEQLLMLTFSRAAATEFKLRLVELIGNAAHYVEIKTFHSYCFDLLGKVGSLEGVEDVIKSATEMIRNGEAESGKITKSVLVIDEAQDMDKNEFDLIRALMQNNDNMRVIAVGDDDQNIFEFRGSDSKYLRNLVEDYGAAKYEMTENYRSKTAIVSLSNAFASTISKRIKTVPCKSVQIESGRVNITHHHCEHMEEAIVEQVIQTRDSGKCCVLTQTNDEALQVLGLLTMRGVKAKLIQSFEGIKLYNVAEIRCFLKIIDSELTSSVISDDLWKKSKDKLFEKYKDSTSLEICRNFISVFEKTNKTKYRRELEEYIKESFIEDFYDDNRETIYISTIHKSKGREFDSVYMLLNHSFAKTDEDKRKLYVGITRAKSNLFIHCNTNLFSNYILSGIHHEEDKKIYSIPKEITIQLTHKDVVLDFFKGKEKMILMLHSGVPLIVSDGYLCTMMNGISTRVAKFSNAFREKLDSLSTKGFKPTAATISFVVVWKDKNENKEIPIVLANMRLERRDDPPRTNITT